MAIKIGEWVKVEYTGTLDDGTIFDSTGENINNPLKIQVGAGQIIKGFDESVLGKALGEEYSIRLEPSEAYGEYKGGLTHKVPKDQFPKSAELHPELKIMVTGPQGQMPASIKSIEEDEVLIDLNHPMAGKVLNFKIKIVETDCEPDPPSACGCGCGADNMNDQNDCS